MAGTIPNEGEEDMLDVLLAGDLLLGLFSNNLNPSESTVLADVTEATFTGYGAKTLTGGAWVSTQGDPTTAVFAAQTFQGTGAEQTVFGYYIRRAASGRLWAIERFASALVAGLGRFPIVVVPTLKF